MSSRPLEQEPGRLPNVLGNPWRSEILYSKQKVGGRVIGTYLGSGELAEAVARLDEIARHQRAVQRQEEHQRREAIRRRLEAEEAPLSEWSERVEAITHAGAEAAGYYRPCRAEWRKQPCPCGRRVKSDPSGAGPGGWAAGIEGFSVALGEGGERRNGLAR